MDDWGKDLWPLWGVSQKEERGKLRTLGSDDKEPLRNVNFREPELELPNPVSLHITLKNIFVVFKWFEEVRNVIHW